MKKRYPKKGSKNTRRRGTMDAMNRGIAVKLTKEQEGKWLALSPKTHKVVAFSANFDSLVTQVGKKEVIYTRIPPPGAVYVF